MEEGAVSPSGVSAAKREERSKEEHAHLILLLLLPGTKRELEEKQELMKMRRNFGRRIEGLVVVSRQ